VFFVIHNSIKKVKKLAIGEEYELDEDLANFFSAIQLKDRKDIVASEEVYMRKFGIKTYEERAFDRLKESESANLDKIMMGVPTYRLLDNLVYQQKL